MKLFGLVVLVLAVFAMLMGGASAAPKGTGSALRKGAKAIEPLRGGSYHSFIEKQQGIFINMKLFGLVVLVLAVFAVLMGGASAAPKGTGSALRKGAKAIAAASNFAGSGAAAAAARSVTVLNGARHSLPAPAPLYSRAGPFDYTQKKQRISINMKLFGLVVLVLAVFAMLMGGASAAPKGTGSALRKGAKAIKAGFGAISAIGTGHEIYQHVKNRG
ncbi:hypothetical protein B5X24_HaOG215077 [Helicoverpa armigera]|uniref:Uncharacterized protein n=1 Tax=Helicoverpa armigera TaxID=29058 RepID=A0A2W1BCF5_HELAM|nr:hypothetical protein B5X24_HaOG215077 [Helicoverpa armigera]